ncbi:MAG TPA: pyridoxamine 5'-phosphate oxidase family protein [Vicinamibacterales bacterium]|nr:pyridoxamine 5'-phosphate oxidase family protein [Vicinamibacterales bacterium]
MTLPTGERIEKDEHLTGDEAIAKIRKLLSSFRAAFFVTGLSRRTHPHSRPLALLGDLSAFGGTLWFFADSRSPKMHELSADATVSLLFQSDADSCYMQLDGSAASVHDRAKMRELYTPALKTWFPEGLDDPNLTLIRFDAVSGAYWESPGGILQAMTAFATSAVNGTPGKSGRSGTLSLR